MARTITVRNYHRTDGTPVVQHERKLDEIPSREKFEKPEEIRNHLVNFDLMKSQDNPEIINLKEFKRMIQSLGYQVKTEVHTFRHLSVYLDGEFIAGSGGNVYSSEKIEKHRAIFDLLIKYRGKIFDTDYEPPLKVLF